MPTLPVTVTDLRRLFLRHRRLVAAILAAACVAVTIEALAPPPATQSRVVVAAHDLPAGSTLSRADLTTTRMPEQSVPRHAMESAADLLGQRVAAPMRKGEPFTDRRIFTSTLVDGYGAHRVAVPVRVDDPGVASLLRVGARVDIYTAVDGDSSKVAARVPVIALPQHHDRDRDAAAALVIVAAKSGDAAALAQANARGSVSIVLHP